MYETRYASVEKRAVRLFHSYVNVKGRSTLKLVPNPFLQHDYEHMTVFLQGEPLK